MKDDDRGIRNLFGARSRVKCSRSVVKRMAWRYTALQEKLAAIQTKLAIKMENKR